MRLARLAALAGSLLAGSRAAAAERADLLIRADPRFELAALIQRSRGEAPATSLAPDQLAYLALSGARAESLKDAPAFKRLADLPASRLDPALFVRVLAALDDPPALTERAPIFSQVLDEFRGRAALDAWLGGIRALARETRFMEGFARDAEPVEPAVRALDAELRRRGLMEKFEAYAGTSFQGRYTVAFAPSLPERLLATSVLKRAGGGYEIVLMPRWSRGSAAERMDAIAYSFLHELGHGLLDPLSEGAPAGFDVREHVAQAAAGRVYELAEGKPAPALRRDLDPAVMARLRRLLVRYEASRKEFPTLAAYYPKLLAAMPSVPSPPAAALPELKDDGTPAYWRELGLARYQKGDAAGALEALDRALKISANDPDVLADRSVILFSVGRFAEAVADDDRLLGLAAGRSAEPSWAALLERARENRSAALARLPATDRKTPSAGDPSPAPR